MPRREGSEVAVTLEECHWRAIADIVIQVCRKRGGAWLLWGRSIGSAIDVAIDGARAQRGMSPTGALQKHGSGPSDPSDRSCAYSQIGDQGRPVIVRRERAEAMIRRGRKGTVLHQAGRYVFQVQTTEEFKCDKWPLDQHEGYHGWVEVDSQKQVVAGDCDCPDNEEGRAVLPSGLVYCKHIGWVKLAIVNGEVEDVERLPVALILGYEGQGEALIAVRDKGRLRKPRHNETVATVRERLVRDGYRLKRTLPANDGSIHQIYV